MGHNKILRKGRFGRKKKTIKRDEEALKSRARVEETWEQVSWHPLVPYLTQLSGDGYLRWIGHPGNNIKKQLLTERM